jgi:alkaline phosphatase
MPGFREFNKSDSKLLAIVGLCCCATVTPLIVRADHVRDMQAKAAEEKKAEWGHWGTKPDEYTHWSSHSNRLIPIYTFGISLDQFDGERSAYRDPARLRALYGRVPPGSVNPDAMYMDQTDVFRLQQQAVLSGKKHIILIIFDGMDWQTTRAAAIHATQCVGYDSGRGNGLAFQDYQASETDFGYFVSSPHNNGTKIDVNAQTVINPGGEGKGGYSAKLGGATPWDKPADDDYLIGKKRDYPDVVTDSAASGTSLMAGIKTFNAAVNVSPSGRQVETIAHQLQRKGFSIGVATSVPISHATPASAYAHNVDRDDYQDLTRDLIGRPSISHRENPLPGVDVLIGCGWGETKDKEEKQGQNYVAGNKYITDEDLKAIDVEHGGKYRVAMRTAGRSGSEVLLEAARQARSEGKRLFGFFGVQDGHLPFRTADGKYDPCKERYTTEDIEENPTLADMARSALGVLSANETGFWLMIEAGDVDWANHSNNIDDSIGAVLSGDAAFQTVVQWVEKRSAWDDTVVIVTADHGHYLVLVDPAALVTPEADDHERVTPHTARKQTPDLLP